MKEQASLPSYKRHRFPPAIIGHAVWLYFHFALSYRDVEELLAERGVIVTYETIRQWCRKFGQTYANELRRRRPRSGDTWHLDEVFVQINGVTHYLWRAKPRLMIADTSSHRARQALGPRWRVVTP
jgi:putative transposase